MGPLQAWQTAALLAVVSPDAAVDADQAVQSAGVSPMSHYASNELWSIFDARRVKAPELKGLDAMANGFVGFFKNRRPVLAKLKAQAARIELLEPQVRHLSSTEFQEKVHDLRALARVNRLQDEALDMAMAVIREAAFRS